MPAARYSIDWHVQPRYERYVKRRPLTALARRALAVEQVESPAVVSVAIVNNQTIRGINRRFRGVDSATDVLSFCLDSRGGPHRDDPVLGEVIIALPTARRQAASAGHGIDHEIAHLLVHGLLHICGYDHERPSEAQRMRAREEALLGQTAH